DRLGWATGFAIRAYGVAVGVRLNRADVLDDVVGCLPYGWRPTRVDRVDALFSVVAGDRPAGEETTAPRRGAKLRRYNMLFGNATRLARTLDTSEFLDRLTSEMRVHVAEFTTKRTFIHAGVVAW